MSRRTNRDVPHFASVDDGLLGDLLRPTRRIGLGLDHTSIDGNCAGVRAKPVITRPFCTLLHLARTTSHADPKVLVVAPLSGHFTILLRDMLSALLPEHDVYVTDWIDAREVPLGAGPFGFEDNVDYVIDFVRALGPGMHLIGLCQSVVPVLAAVALLAATDDPAQPASMTLIAGPVDPRRNPTRVDRLLAERPITWLERATIAAIPDRYPGAGRRVYPALIQLAALMMHLARHVGTGGELFQKLIADDGEDPEHWPFHALYTAVMDLPAEFFIDQVTTVFKESALPRGRLMLGRCGPVGRYSNVGRNTATLARCRVAFTDRAEFYHDRQRRTVGTGAAVGAITAVARFRLGQKAWVAVSKIRIWRTPRA